MTEIRHNLLRDFQYIITDDLSIKRCLKGLEKSTFNNRISQEYLDTIEHYYEFRDDYEDKGEQISECFDDLLLLMMKLSEEYMRGLELMDTWKNNLEDEMDVIKGELREYLAECFYSFGKTVKRKVKKMLSSIKY